MSRATRCDDVDGRDNATMFTESAGRANSEGTKLVVMESLAGTIGGALGLAVGYPFDTVRVRLQNPEIAHRYKSMIHAFRKIVKEERSAGLFKGIASPMLTLAPLNGFFFGCYGYFLRAQSPSPTEVPSLIHVTIAGSLAGVLASSITAPVELIKIRQQNMVSAVGVPSTIDVVRSISRQHGLPGLYRGFTATALRDAGGGPYFLAYEVVTRVSPSSPLTPLLAGGIAGVVGWLSTFPFDVIKTRMQSVDRDVSGEYRSTWSTARASLRDESWRVFWKGLRPALIETIPVNMATFGAFELVLHFLR